MQFSDTCHYVAKTRNELRACFKIRPSHIIFCINIIAKTRQSTFYCPDTSEGRAIWQLPTSPTSPYCCETTGKRESEKTTRRQRDNQLYCPASPRRAICQPPTSSNVPILLTDNEITGRCEKTGRREKMTRQGDDIQDKNNIAKMQQSTLLSRRMSKEGYLATSCIFQAHHIVAR